MSSQPRLFRIEQVDAEHKAKQVEEVDFSTLGLRERQDIQEWVAAHPNILGDDLLIIAKEFNAFDGTNERADLVAVDSQGTVVTIELKRDDSGADAHWQAVKYASYFRGASAEHIVELLADYADVEADKAADQLREHMGIEDNDLSGLNRRQRIILASHRFAPEVTSAVLWLNEQAEFSDLITCVTLIPHRDQDALYLQATTLLPVPGTESLEVTVGSPSRSPAVSGKSSGSRGYKDDAITRFLHRVGDRVVDELAPELQPDKKSRWAGQRYGYRYYEFRYLTPPWNNWSMKFEVNLHDANDTGVARVDIGLSCDKASLQSKVGFSEQEYVKLKDRLKQISGSELGNQFRLHDDYEKWDGMWLGTSVQGKAMTDEFRESIQTTVVTLIETAKPAIDDLAAQWNEQ